MLFRVVIGRNISVFILFFPFFFFSSSDFNSHSFSVWAAKRRFIDTCASRSIRQTAAPSPVALWSVTPSSRGTCTRYYCNIDGGGGDANAVCRKRLAENAVSIESGDQFFPPKKYSNFSTTRKSQRFFLPPFLAVSRGKFRFSSVGLCVGVPPRRLLLGLSSESRRKHGQWRHHPSPPPDVHERASVISVQSSLIRIRFFNNYD